MTEPVTPFWIDIGAAPKDGSSVDLWCIRYELPDPSKPDVRKVGKRFIDCRWVDPAKSTMGANYAVGITGGLENPAKWEGNGLSKEWRPTHWMRVTPPKDAS